MLVLDLKKGAFPIGHVSRRADGDYKKVSRNKWVRIVAAPTVPGGKNELRPAPLSGPPRSDQDLIAAFNTIPESASRGRRPPPRADTVTHPAVAALNGHDARVKKEHVRVGDTYRQEKKVTPAQYKAANKAIKTLFESKVAYHQGDRQKAKDLADEAERLAMFGWAALIPIKLTNKTRRAKALAYLRAGYRSVFGGGERVAKYRKLLAENKPLPWTKLSRAEMRRNSAMQTESRWWNQNKTILSPREYAEHAKTVEKLTPKQQITPLAGYAASTKELDAFMVQALKKTRHRRSIKDGRIVAGSHWGSAHKTNMTAQMVAGLRYSEWRPIDQDMKVTPIKIGDSALDTGVKMRGYAQLALEGTPRKQWPTLHRGMMIPLEVAQAIDVGSEIPLTGCTAFSFYPSIADQYRASKWTARLSAGKGPSVPVVLTLKRNDKVDDSISMWHPNKGRGLSREGRRDAAFEVLSDLPKVKVKSAEWVGQGQTSYLNLEVEST